MVSIEEIDKTILDLENHDTTYATCEKLAWLYIVRDHLTGTPASVSHETAPIFDSSSKFMQAASGANITELMLVLDDHMNELQVVYPKEYDLIVDRIKSLNHSH